MKFKIIALFASVAILLLATACGSESTADDDAHMEEDDHHEEDDHGHDESDDHEHDPDGSMAMMHNVPEEAAAVPNPIESSDESVEIGGTLFTTNCVTCHGEKGLGDGPAAAALEKKPANLTEDHVQELSDGSLFYIITNGRPETPMPAWEEVLDEEQRWNVVNFLRTLP